MGGAAAHTVLVVDDDDSLRMLCRVNLELEGYRVLEAGTTEAAAETLASEPVNAVLLDVHVGEADGVVPKPFRLEELLDVVRGLTPHR